MSKVSEAFMIVLTDGDSDIYTYSIPSAKSLPTFVFRTFGDAKMAMLSYSKNLPAFLPVAYGVAYPYEETSFEQELAQKGFACYGWQTITDPESGETAKIKLGILRVGLA